MVVDVVGLGGAAASAMRKRARKLAGNHAGREQKSRPADR
jgi:hypothetical protein